MSSDFQFEHWLRHLKLGKHQERLTYRDRSQLMFLRKLRPPFPKLLLDTTVYVDALQGRIPDYVEIPLRAAHLWHCTVTESELTVFSRRLDPKHQDTDEVVAQLAASMDLRPVHRILTPDRNIWREAGILAGLIARLQGYGKAEQRKALGVAAIFRTAAKHDCVVLTRNVSDFDLLMQVDSTVQAVFYDLLGKPSVRSAAVETSD